MKKRGVTFIETIVAITIFLIGIIPVAQLTLNSLRSLKRASEIEEGARVTTTVINYIKSQGYSSVMESGGLLSSYDKTTPSQIVEERNYILDLSDDGSSYVLNFNPKNAATNPGGDDFETDFLGRVSWPAGGPTPENSLFLINSLGISSDNISIAVNIATSDLKVEGEFYNPVTDTSTTSSDGIIIGEGGIIQDPLIFGNVAVTYETLSNTSSKKKTYEQSFVITPIENFVTSP